MNVHRWLVVPVLGFAGGIAIRSGAPDFAGAFYFAVFVFLLGAAVCFSYALFRAKGKHGGGMALVALALIAAGLGMARFDAAHLNRGDPLLDAVIDEQISFLGVVVAERDEREAHVKLTVRADALGEEVALNGASKVLVVANHYPEFRYGDEVRISGKLARPENFEPNDDIGRSFNYVSYLAKDDIFYLMFYPKIEPVRHGKGNPIRAGLFSFKHALIENLERTIPEPHSSLLSGILLGAKHSLGKDLLDAFRATGIIHIVVLSGYNVTIIADAIGRVFSLLPVSRAITILLSGAGVGAFALMTGGATVARASLMAFLVLLARLTGRTYAILNALFVAGFMMLVWNPLILAFDPSFQLSFLATFGLITLAPLVERRLGWLPTKLQIREFATATIATQLFVLPLLLYMVGEVSLVAIFVNILVLPTIPLAMLSGFFASVAGFMNTAAALPFAYIAFALLAYELFVVALFAALPFASVVVGTVSPWVPAVVYAVFMLLAVRLVNTTREISV